MQFEAVHIALAHGSEAAENASFADMAFEVLADAVVDTLYLLPFLFVTYLVMEWLEHRTGDSAQQAIRRAGVFGPAIGAVLGVVPQCGFSAAASTLYAGRVITLGTMFAVFLSTSDEMLPIFIAEQVPLQTMGAILGAKIVLGMAFGFAVDAVLRASSRAQEGLRIHQLCEDAGCSCDDDCETCKSNPELAYEHHDDCAGECDHEHHHHDHTHDSEWGGIAKSALVHTLQVTLFVFLVSLVLNVVLVGVGEEALEQAFGENALLATIGSGLFGLIPNCAASVAIAQLYVEGVLGAGAMMAGLLSAAGVGMLVLLRTNKDARGNALIVCVLVAFSIACGLVIDALGIVF